MTLSPDRPADVSGLLGRWAAERPDAEALRFQGVRRTWAELDERVRRLAAALRAAGVGAGDRVAVLDLNHPSCLELTLACARIGAANAVVNFRLAPPEIVHVLNDSGAVLLLVGPEFVQAAEALRGEAPALRRVVRASGDDGGGDEYEAWLAAHEPETGPAEVDPDACFVQLYTSGTTGFPKGVMLTHRAMLAHSTNVAESFEVDHDAVVQVAMPLFHVGGTSYALLAIHFGARIVMLRVPDPAAVVEQLAGERITHTFLVPALLAAIAQVPGVGTRDLSAMKVLSYGASPMPLPVMRACLPLFPGRMHQVYGMTEACGVVTALSAADHEDPAVAHRLVSAGTPIHGVEIEVRDPATGEPVPTGEPGEIWVRTAQLMAGYWRQPEATAAAVTPDGWLRSGDGGHLDADGYVYVTDRVKDMIVSGGENVYPAEIERVLAEYPGIADVAVIGVPDDRWGEVPRAIVVATADAEGARLDEAAVLAHCRAHLASYKCPKGVEVVAELPRNPTGKILKKDLRTPFWSGRERRTV
ncbi:long-chain-fatty-acid--CoA ligase [Pseudonocardia sp. RS11V-5]|uniref:long-chain-fatty-acid--CoA ligase n=1 Tax=Pseudonocardia terrae TaxID=2905831 RepID=UPI001E58207E|nr:long-chain-fatty-acid--CoA ligase [Pseudonocardia terrae]MCE3550279.1 long-chain-fatty-acid--CoA ligase [Pseudonocardia terrae]